MRSVHRAILGIGLVTFSCLTSGSLVKAADSTTAPDNKILVLPFHALNSSEYQQWLGRSIQQSLVADLTVAAPGRVLSKDAEAKDAADAADVGHREGARYVVFGNFATVEQTLRVTGELVDVSNGKTVTGLKATGSVKDVFRLEDELAGEVRQPLALGSGAQQMPQVIYGPVTAPQSAPANDYYQTYGAQQPSYYYYPPQSDNYYYNYYGTPSYDYGYAPYGWGSWYSPFWWGGVVFVSPGFGFHHHHRDFDHDGDFDDHGSHVRFGTTGVGVGTLHAGVGTNFSGVGTNFGGVSAFHGGVSAFHGGVSTFHGSTGTFHGGAGTFHAAPRMGGGFHSFGGGFSGGARTGSAGGAHH